VSFSFFGLPWLHFRWRRRSTSLDLWRFSCHASIFHNEHYRQQTLINPPRTRQHQLQTTALQHGFFPFVITHSSQTRQKRKLFDSANTPPLALQHPTNDHQKHNPQNSENTPSILTHAYNTHTVWIPNASFLCQQHYWSSKRTGYPTYY
jgi:hypothetical protein